jgi:hypothetical protein
MRNGQGAGARVRLPPFVPAEAGIQQIAGWVEPSEPIISKQEDGSAQALYTPYALFYLTASRSPATSYASYVFCRTEVDVRDRPIEKR